MTKQPRTVWSSSVSQDARHFTAAGLAGNEPQPDSLERQADVVLVPQRLHLALAEQGEQRAILMAVQKQPAAAIAHALGLQRPGKLHALHIDDALATHSVA